MRNSNRPSSGVHDEIERDSRPKALRQDRYEVTEEDCVLRVAGERLRVVNYSAFGLAVTSTEKIELNTGEGDLYCGETKVCTVRLRKAREIQDTEKGTYLTGFEVTSESISIDRVRSILEAQAMLNNLTGEFNQWHVVPADFRHKVHEARELLQQLSDAVNGLRGQQSFESSARQEEFENAVIDVVSNFLFVHFTPMYYELAKTLEKCEKPVVKAAYGYFREKLRDLIYSSPFADRSFRKPLGYAGDFEVMNLIYRDENIGSHLFAKCIHRYFVEHPETRAVKNRAVYLGHKIEALLKKESRREKLKILSVASGPAVEIQRLVQSWNHGDLVDVEIHLLDQDLFSLKHAQSQIREACRLAGKKPTVRFFHQTIKNIVINGLETNDYDLIYSAGLFDYFSDPVAQAAAKQLHNALSPSGQLVIGNFNASTPNKFFMEAALDWHLVFRSEADLTRMYGDIGSNLKVELEPETVNLFCIISK
jgi:extracellular factor (EF) 3-hydroxypalmitic acid methyl ester biosynthesis protein